MAFSSRRGRPRATTDDAPDFGTPELRHKHQLGLTREPIDHCFEKGLISADQHRSGLHLRWLYTLRYGAPSLIARYREYDVENRLATSDEWRSAREEEYRSAVTLLQNHRRHDAVMRLAIHNETPAFLSTALLEKSWSQPALANALDRLHRELCEGLELLTQHWVRERQDGSAATAAPQRQI